MFAIVATLPLNDRTRGFRYNILGKKGLCRLRKYESRGWFKYEPLDTMNAYHFGRLTIYIKHAYGRKLHHFAG